MSFSPLESYVDDRYVPRVQDGKEEGGNGGKYPLWYDRKREGHWPVDMESNPSYTDDRFCPRDENDYEDDSVWGTTTVPRQTPLDPTLLWKLQRQGAEARLAMINRGQLEGRSVAKRDTADLKATALEKKKGTRCNAGAEHAAYRATEGAECIPVESVSKWLSGVEPMSKENQTLRNQKQKAEKVASHAVEREQGTAQRASHGLDKAPVPKAKETGGQDKVTVEKGFRDEGRQSSEPESTPKRTKGVCIMGKDGRMSFYPWEWFKSDDDPVSSRARVAEKSTWSEPKHSPKDPQGAHPFSVRPKPETVQPRESRHQPSRVQDFTVDLPKSMPTNYPQTRTEASRSQVEKPSSNPATRKDGEYVERGRRVPDAVKATATSPVKERDKPPSNDASRQHASEKVHGKPLSNHHSRQHASEKAHDKPPSNDASEQHASEKARRDATKVGARTVPPYSGRPLEQSQKHQTSQNPVTERSGDRKQSIYIDHPSSSWGKAYDQPSQKAQSSRAEATGRSKHSKSTREAEKVASFPDVKNDLAVTPRYTSVKDALERFEEGKSRHKDAERASASRSRELSKVEKLELEHYELVKRMDAYAESGKHEKRAPGSSAIKDSAREASSARTKIEKLESENYELAKRMDAYVESSKHAERAAGHSAIKCSRREASGACTNIEKVESEYYELAKRTNARASGRDGSNTLNPSTARSLSCQNPRPAALDTIFAGRGWVSPHPLSPVSRTESAIEVPSRDGYAKMMSYDEFREVSGSEAAQLRSRSCVTLRDYNESASRRQSTSIASNRSSRPDSGRDGGEKAFDTRLPSARLQRQDFDGNTTYRAPTVETIYGSSNVRASATAGNTSRIAPTVETIYSGSNARSSAQRVSTTIKREDWFEQSNYRAPTVETDHSSSSRAEAIRESQRPLTDWGQWDVKSERSRQRDRASERSRSDARGRIQAKRAEAGVDEDVYAVYDDAAVYECLMDAATKGHGVGQKPR